MGSPFLLSPLFLFYPHCFCSIPIVSVLFPLFLCNFSVSVYPHRFCLSPSFLFIPIVSVYPHCFYLVNLSIYLSNQLINIFSVRFLFFPVVSLYFHRFFVFPSFLCISIVSLYFHIIDSQHFPH